MKYLDMELSSELKTLVKDAETKCKNQKTSFKDKFKLKMKA